jgi:hypothetical protein
MDVKSLDWTYPIGADFDAINEQQRKNLYLKKREMLDKLAIENPEIDLR